MSDEEEQLNGTKGVREVCYITDEDKDNDGDDEDEGLHGESLLPATHVDSPSYI